jgi:hypothetical protein
VSINNSNNRKHQPVDLDNQSLKEYRQLLDEASYRRIEPVNGFERILLQSHEPDFLLREVIKQILIENQNRPMTRDEIKTTIPQLNFHDTITEMMQDKVVIEEFSEERQQKVYSVKSWRSLE